MISLVLGAALALAAQDVAPSAQQAPAVAQATVVPAVGMRVVAQDGSPIGTVTQADATVVVVDTGAVKVGIAPASFASKDGALMIGTTRAEIEAAGRKAAADAVAAMSSLMVVGTQVVDQAGGVVGKVASVDADNVVVATAAHRAALPKSAFVAKGATLMIGMTAAQLDEAVSKAAK